MCWTQFKTIGHRSKVLGPSQKTFRPSWGPKLVTGLIASLIPCISSVIHASCFCMLLSWCGKCLRFSMLVIRRSMFPDISSQWLHVAPWPLFLACFDVLYHFLAVVFSLLLCSSSNSNKSETVTAPSLQHLIQIEWNIECRLGPPSPPLESPLYGPFNRNVVGIVSGSVHWRPSLWQTLRWPVEYCARYTWCSSKTTAICKYTADWLHCLWDDWSQRSE